MVWGGVGWGGVGWGGVWRGGEGWGGVGWGWGGVGWGGIQSRITIPDQFTVHCLQVTDSFVAVDNTNNNNYY